MKVEFTILNNPRINRITKYIKSFEGTMEEYLTIQKELKIRMSSDVLFK